MSLPSEAPPASEQQQGVRLLRPIAFQFDLAPAYRAGPSCLPSDALADAPDTRWAAYWYQHHDHTCMTSCHCWTVVENHVYFAFDGGGDGVLLVQHANGDVGVYSLAHTRSNAAVDWARFARCKNARMTAEQFRALRDSCARMAPGFGDPKTDFYAPPVGADAIWEAWDAAVSKFRKRHP